MKRYGIKKVLSHSWFKDIGVERGLRPRYNSNDVYEGLLKEVLKDSEIKFEEMKEVIVKYKKKEMKERENDTIMGV